MTNKEIIFETIQMEGKLELVESYLNNELLTFAEWKRRGYKVNKGEKAVLKAALWKKGEKKKKMRKTKRKKSLTSSLKYLPCSLRIKYQELSKKSLDKRL